MTTTEQLHLKNLVIFGATSAIAQAVASIHAGMGYELVLVGRNKEKLDQISDHLQVLGARAVHVLIQDLNLFEQHELLLEQILTKIGRFDRVLIAQGTLPNQTELQKSYQATAQCINDNGLSSISLATPIANAMEQQQHGQIAFISSVAGDRGRQSNYIYGASKSLVSTFAAGLRNRLASANVHVLTIKPGFVDTPMTAHIAKGALWAQPETVAHDIVKGFDKRKNIIYTPWFWRYIMLIILHIPEFIFKKLKL